MNDSLRAPNYRRRVVDSELDELLAGAAAVSLEGAKGVGKSATAAERVDAEFRLESPAVRDLVEADPDRLVDGRRVLLDEWQHLPFTWDVVRRAVDGGATPGQFLLTGSASLADPASDLAFGNIVVRKNNFAQRNLSVIDVFASVLISFPFVIGSRFSKERLTHLEIDRSRMPGNTRFELRLDGNEKMFPLVDFSHRSEAEANEEVVFEDRAQLLTRIGQCDVKLTLEKGSRMELRCRERAPLKVRRVLGGELRPDEGGQTIELTEATTRIDLEVEPAAMHALALRIAFPAILKRGDDGTVVARQVDADGAALGGATVVVFHVSDVVG